MAGRHWLLSQCLHESYPQLLIEILVSGGGAHADDEQIPAETEEAAGCDDEEE
jgi:hypothetical protein